MTSAPPPASVDRPRGVLLAVVLTSLNLRTAVTGFSVLIATAADALRFGDVVSGAIGSLVTGCFAVAAFLAPGLARRLGLERTAALAMTATTVGILVRAFAGSPAVLLVGTVVTFAGIGTANVILVPLVKVHFPTRLHRLSTTYMVLLQVGQFAAPVIALPLSLAFGWRPAAGIWAVLTAGAAASWFAASRRAHAQAAPARPARVRIHWRTTAVVGLVGLMSMTTLHTYTLVTWLPTMFADAGLDDTRSALLLSWFSALGLLAAFVVPAAAGRLRNPYPVVLACVVLLGAGYTGMWLDPSGGALGWATLLGLGLSTFPLCLTLVGLRSDTPAHASSLSGLVQGVGYGIGCVGPLTLGALNGASGSWNSSYALLAGTLVITLLAGWWACRPTPSPRG